MAAAGVLFTTVLLRIYVEDALCIGKKGFSSLPEIGHMILWWISILMTFILIVSKHAKRHLYDVLIFTAFMAPGILFPPIYDYCVGGRCFDYPYPSGDLGSYFVWMINYMPDYVTLGQKIEITGMFCLIFSYIVFFQRTMFGVLYGIQAVLVTYILFSFYAWFPSFFRSFWSWAAASHDLFIIATMSLVILGQASLIILKRRDWHV